MLSTLEIGLIIFILVIVGLIVYTLFNRKNEIQKLLNNVTKAFGIKTAKTSENFGTDVVFNTIEDTIKNMNEFIKYLAPNIDIENINKLLKEYNLNKTAQTIFDEHKDMDPNKYYQVLSFDIIFNIGLINSIIINENDIENIMRLHTIILITFAKLMINYLLKIDQNIKQTYGGIDKLTLEINEDYMTSENITIYARTTNNENISINNAEEHTYLFFNKETGNETETLKCFSTEKLCKTTSSINENIKQIKDESIDFIIKNKDKILQFYNLLFVKMLFDFNNTANDGTTIATPIISEKLNNDYNELKEFLKPLDTHTILLII
jgi:hypothetical protein